MSEKTPPWPLRLLHWFCPAQLLEEIEGDLIQKYNHDAKNFGEKRAKRRLIWNVIRFLRPGIVLRNKWSLELTTMKMLSNYMKITLRNLNKRRAYSIVNLLGLSIGLAACLVIGKYVEYETSYESFNTNARSVYRVVSSFYTDGAKESFSGYDLGPALQAEMPEVKRIARFHGHSSVISFKDAQGKQLRFYEGDINAVDSTFFKMFTFRFVYGNEDALTGANSIVLTETVARKYFGNENPIGKELTIHDNWPGIYSVSAVIEDLPSNTHFNFKVLMPLHNILQSEYYRNQNARWDNFHTYLELYEHADKSQLDSKIPAFIKNYRGEDQTINAKSELQFQSLLDIHYSPDLNRQDSHRTQIYFFVLIAIFILVMAWINYINLSTARAIERAREVGVKKALGVLRTQLISQFVFEAVLINLISVMISIVFAWLMLPVLNAVTGQSFEFDLLQPKFWGLLMVLFAIGSLASGFYPAFVLSSYKTTEVIKGKVATGTSGWSIRSGLVVFQFACSLLLIVGTIVIHRQLGYLHAQNKNLKIDQTIIVKGPQTAEPNGLNDRVISLKNELSQLANVSQVATSFSVPAKDASFAGGIRRLGQTLEEKRIGNIYWVDPDFMSLYEISLLAGKQWDDRLPSEMKQAIINEEAVKVFQLGTNENALKEKLITPFDTLTILGVVKNHHWYSLKVPHQPMIFRVEKISASNISIRLNGDVSQAIEQIKKTYQDVFPGEAFSYYFLDDYYASTYNTEQQSGKLFSAFSALAILIGCLGLWALASFTTLHRMKEISIRKVLGASVHSILMLLSRQFLKPLLIGCILALPLAWIGINQWLEQFPYRINIAIELFLIPVTLLVALAVATISTQTVGAAASNPVKFLKSE